MYLSEMTGAKNLIHKYKVLQCSKLFYSKVSSGFPRQDSQSTYSFGKIQNVRGLELSKEKKFSVALEKDFIFLFYKYSLETF